MRDFMLVAANIISLIAAWLVASLVTVVVSLLDLALARLERLATGRKAA